MDNIKIYSFNNRENKWDINSRHTVNIHCDFEQTIIRAIRQVYPNCEIKLSLWHFYIFSIPILSVKDCFDLISEYEEDDEKDNKLVNEYLKP